MGLLHLALPALLLVAAQPAHARDIPSRPAPEASADAADVDRAITGYGEWLIRLDSALTAQNQVLAR